MNTYPAIVALGATKTSPNNKGFKLYKLTIVRALVYFYEYLPTGYILFVLENNDLQKVFLNILVIISYLFNMYYNFFIIYI
jgi:hypothetical protein